MSAVDDDGNEIAGICPPAAAAPLAAYTGWNPRRHIDGLPDVLYERLGSKVPFPPGQASIPDWYPKREDYAVAVRAAVNTLVAEWLLLPGDVEPVVDAAVARY